MNLESIPEMSQHDARSLVRAVVEAFGADLVVKEVACRVQETNERFQLSRFERQRVWTWLHDLLPRGDE